MAQAPAKAPPKVTLATLKSWVTSLESTIEGLEEQEPKGDQAIDKRDAKVQAFEELLEAVEAAVSEIESL